MTSRMFFGGKLYPEVTSAAFAVAWADFAPGGDVFTADEAVVTADAAVVTADAAVVTVDVAVLAAPGDFVDTAAVLTFDGDA